MQASDKLRVPRSPFPVPRSTQHGFSLLEVIAAILLLAIAFTALMKVAGGAIALSQNAAGYGQAAMYARSRLDSAFVGRALQSANASGQFDPNYRWTLAVTPWIESGTPPPGAPLQLYQLDLTVFWGPLGHPRSAHFRTLRLGTPDAPGNVVQAAQAVR